MTFPTNDIAINEMFKKSGFYVVNPVIENGLFFIKIHASKVKSKADLENAFDKVKKVAEENGFNINLDERGFQFVPRYCREHGTYYHIYFKSN